MISRLEQMVNNIDLYIRRDGDNKEVYLIDLSNVSIYVKDFEEQLGLYYMLFRKKWFLFDEKAGTIRLKSIV